VILKFTRELCLWLWNRKLDPHNIALPYMTSLGDLLGSTSLVVAFSILVALKDDSLGTDAQ
jgi:cation transporter-like permease